MHLYGKYTPSHKPWPSASVCVQCIFPIYTPALGYIQCGFDLFTEDVVKTRIVSAIKSIQNRTCIKFKVSRLVSLNTSIRENFVVVFSNCGNRYVLYIKMLCLHMYRM